MFIIIIWGIVAAFFRQFSVICSKWLSVRRKVSIQISTMVFMLVNGIIGTVCLITTTVFMRTGLFEISSMGFGMIMIAGLLDFTSLIILNSLNFANSPGQTEGVTSAIFNTYAAIHVLLASLCFR